jgi:hypothetical protein
MNGLSIVIAKADFRMPSQFKMLHCAPLPSDGAAIAPSAELLPAALVGTWKLEHGIRTQSYAFAADGTYRSVLSYDGAVDDYTRHGFRAVVEGSVECSGGELLLSPTQGQIEIINGAETTVSKGSYPPKRTCNWLVQGDMLILTEQNSIQTYLRA